MSHVARGDGTGLALRLAVLTALVNGALVGTFAFYGILPPALTLAMTEILFVLAIVFRAKAATRV